MIKRNN